MHSGYSPYDMRNEAIRLINHLKENGFSKESEKQIILLLNKAEEHDYMSKQKLSVARKKLADMYYSYGITGNALDQYNAALLLYPKSPVMKKLKELSSIPTNQLVYSLDCNMVGDPDYSALTYHEIEIPEEMKIERAKHDAKMAEMFGMSYEEYQSYRRELEEQMMSEADEIDRIYDPEWEREIEERLSKLDELSRSEFYRLRTTRKRNGPLSIRELEELTLEAMERSYNYQKDK